MVDAFSKIFELRRSRRQQLHEKDLKKEEKGEREKKKEVDYSLVCVYELPKAS